MPEGFCTICGKALPPRRRSYCSDACRDEYWHRYWHKITEKGKLIKGYRPVSWPAIAAEKIRETPVCKNCGAIKDLEVHHIVPLKLGGDNQLSNLVVLCHDCHRAQHPGKPRGGGNIKAIQTTFLQ